MTEQEWLTWTSPYYMVRFLLGTDQPRIIDIPAFPACRGSQRKLRLFACACWRRISHLLQNVVAHRAVETAERFADGLLPVEELEEAHATVYKAVLEIEDPWRVSEGAVRRALLPAHSALSLALQVTRPLAEHAAYYSRSNASYAVAAFHDRRGSDGPEEEAQTHLLRDIFGPVLFRPAPVVDPSWLAWNGGALTGLAETIYAERAFADLPILADALEEAGCDNEEMLNHCRTPDLVHVRGCWLVDLLLNRE